MQRAVGTTNSPLRGAHAGNQVDQAPTCPGARPFAHFRPAARRFPLPIGIER